MSKSIHPPIRPTPPPGRRKSRTAEAFASSQFIPLRRTLSLAQGSTACRKAPCSVTTPKWQPTTRWCALLSSCLALRFVRRLFTTAAPTTTALWGWQLAISPFRPPSIARMSRSIPADCYKLWRTVSLPIRRPCTANRSTVRPVGLAKSEELVKTLFPLGGAQAPRAGPPERLRAKVTGEPAIDRCTVDQSFHVTCNREEISLNGCLPDFFGSGPRAHERLSGDLILHRKCTSQSFPLSNISLCSWSLWKSGIGGLIKPYRAKFLRS
jgi:hypothetical protein